MIGEKLAYGGLAKSVKPILNVTKFPQKNFFFVNVLLYMVMQCESIFPWHAHAQHFSQHDHAQHGATLSIRLVRSLMVWGPQSKK